MAELKVSDRVRLSTGVEGVVFQLNDDNSTVFEVGDKKYFVDQDLERIGVTWELVEPALVEPPVGSVIRFVSNDKFQQIAIRRRVFWRVNGSGDDWTWAELLDYSASGTFELLRSEKEVVKEVLYKLQGFLNDHSYARVQKIAKEYGVTL